MSVAWLCSCLFLGAVGGVWSLPKPSWESQWLNMEGNGDLRDDVFRNVSHGLDVLPVRVQVLVKSTVEGGPNEGFLFEASPSAQHDDYGNNYGGIIYAFNENEVILYAPKMLNNRAIGYGLYVGQEGYTRGNSEATAAVMVKVRVWAPCSFPLPHWTSPWVDMSSENGPHHLQLTHTLGADPVFAVLQVRFQFSTTYYSHGLGSAMSDCGLRSRNDYGGVIYGYDNKQVKIWMSDEGGVWFATDGWGPNGIGAEALDGQVRVMLWKSLPSKHVFHTATPISISAPVPDIATPTRDSETYFRQVLVQATTGPYSGMTFPATYGSQQFEECSKAYGGVVIGWSNNKIRVWVPQPNATTAGVISLGMQGWGKGVNIATVPSAYLLTTILQFDDEWHPCNPEAGGRCEHSSGEMTGFKCECTGTGYVGNSCQEKHFCAPNPGVTNAVIVDLSGQELGAWATVQCLPGYVFGSPMAGTQRLNTTCTSSLKWEAVPVCEKRSCGDHPMLAFSSLFNKTGNVFGDTATYMCDEGSTTDDGVRVQTTKCQADGTWSRLMPCHDIRCGLYDISSFNNTYFNANSDLSGDEGKVACLPGYESARGEASWTLTCVTDGQWLDKSSTCCDCSVLTKTHMKERMRGNGEQHTTRFIFAIIFFIIGILALGASITVAVVMWRKWRVMRGASPETRVAVAFNDELQHTYMD